MTDECKKIMKLMEEQKKKKAKTAKSWFNNTGAGGWN